jgi:hypothetical protein
MSPPIRGPAHQARLRAALAGGLLGVVATDHAPFNSSQKRAGAADFRAIPNGVNGIEERLHVTWDALVAPGARRPCLHSWHRWRALSGVGIGMMGVGMLGAHVRPLSGCLYHLLSGAVRKSPDQCCAAMRLCCWRPPRRKLRLRQQVSAV